MAVEGRHTGQQQALQVTLGVRVSSSRRPGSRPYRAQLRTRLITLGFDDHHVVEQIAQDLIARCGKRPREAWRVARELSLDAAAERFNAIRGDDRAAMRKGRIWDFEQWPHGGVRPTLATLRTLAQVYGTTWDRLVDLDDLSQVPAEDRDAYHAMLAALRRSIAPPLAGHVTVVDREPAQERPSRDEASPEHVIEEAAEESAELTTWAGSSNVTDETLAELTQRLRSLAHAYVYSPPYPLLLRTRKLRNRVSRLLQGRQNPAHSRDLYLLNARSCTLLAWMTGDLGNYLAAGDHASAAWMCAQMADHHGARTWVRATQSKLAYWSGDYVESTRLASDGLTYARVDSAGALLALLEARAHARIGRVSDANDALARWQEEREHIPGPDQVGGVLGLSEAQQHYLAGSTYLELRQPADALTETDNAIGLFEATPIEQRFYGAEILARIDAVRAHLQAGDLDGAAQAIPPILAVDPDQRLDTFVQGLDQVRRCLAHPQYRGSPEAQQLQEGIEDYATGAIGRSVDLRR
jgi:transcriptional regulator with XRE-family HTH domain